MNFYDIYENNVRRNTCYIIIRHKDEVLIIM